MKTRAIVAGIGDSWIELLSLDETEQAHDEKCGGGSGCASNGAGADGNNSGGGCGCRVSGRPFRAEVPRNLKIRTGDTVDVTFSSSRALAASLVVFGVPLAFAAGAWFLFTSLFPGLSEGAIVGISAAALIFGVTLTVLAAGRINKRKLPQITAVIKDKTQINNQEVM